MYYNPNPFERLLKRLIARQVAKIEKLMDSSVGQMAWLASRVNPPKNGSFFFKDYPALSKAVDVILKNLSKKVFEQVLVGSADAWELANLNNDKLLDYIVQSIGRDRIPPLSLLRWQHATRNLEALKAFQERKTEGLGLSERVWHYTKAIKSELELAIDIGLGDGKSADALSRAVRRYLHNPDALFRRVRDKDSGRLRLSKAAAAYHPGQGVYRSAYKNARRLAATETNMAYRTADHERRQGVDFILGIRINLSKNHTCLDAKGEPQPFFDICDILAGDYPKWFKFTGWHPQCRCYVTTILPTREEFFKYLDAMDENGVSSYHFSNEVTELPPQFKAWMKENESRALAAKSLPYFIKDNPDAVTSTKLLAKIYAETGTISNKKEEDEPIVSVPTILERAEARHAARTQEEIDDIKLRWAARLKTNTAPEWDWDKKYPHELDRLVALENYIGVAMDDNPQKRWMLASLKASRSVDDFMRVGGWGRAGRGLYDLGAQYNDLMRVNIYDIRPEWRERYIQLISELNAAKNETLWAKRAAIGEAFNITELSELAEAGIIRADKFSTRTPAEWVYKLKGRFGIKSLPQKKFFDALPHFVPLFVVNDEDTAYYNTYTDFVCIGFGTNQTPRYKASAWYRESIFYHEYGHAQFSALDLEHNKAFLKAYKSFANRVRADGDREYYALLHGINKVINSSEYQNDYLNLRELLGAYSDSLQAASRTKEQLKPAGHAKTYYTSSASNCMTEIYAHISENLWCGNPYFESIDKQTYDLFMAFIKKLLKIR